MKRLAQSGFTFLEVMIAVAVIAIAFVTLIGSQSQSVSVAAHSRVDVMASLLARKKLTELESAGFDELYSEDGSFEESDFDLNWQAQVAPLSAEEAGIEGADDMLKTIDLTITLGGDERVVYSVRSIVMKKITPQGQ
jgi:general secretion pathway protein I